MFAQADAPLFVRHDLAVLLETDHPAFEEVRETLAMFAELVKSPDRLHTYQMTPLSLWNAAAAGMTAEAALGFLQRYGKFAVPAKVAAELRTLMNRYGLLTLEAGGEGELRLLAAEPGLLRKLAAYPSIGGLFPHGISEDGARAELPSALRGTIKRELMRLGYPVRDTAGYHAGETLELRLRRDVRLRDYQQAALDAFYRGGSEEGGSGVVVLPCGAGKTVVGIAAMAQLGCATLILTPNATSVRQWIDEIVGKTNVPRHTVGAYDGSSKQVRPITVATYHILAHRPSRSGMFPHMQLLQKRDWGLLIYDEVHLLPAPIFRVTADIQATRRLGMTATLVREDGHEQDVFSLVGPKRFDMPWRALERGGWIARVDCCELHVPLPPDGKRRYEQAAEKQRHRIAAENPRKLEALRELLARHEDEPTLVIGLYRSQLRAAAAQLGAPVISGETPQEEREELYRRFRAGSLRLLVVGKVANFAVDLPTAAVAVQLSGSFGSRQEEAQRLGRLLRPKPGANRAYFYTVVTEGTKEQDFAARRRQFMAEQGYGYRVETAAADPFRAEMLPGAGVQA